MKRTTAAASPEDSFPTHPLLEVCQFLLIHSTTAVDWQYLEITLRGGNAPSLTQSSSLPPSIPKSLTHVGNTKVKEAKKDPRGGHSTPFILL